MTKHVVFAMVNHSLGKMSDSASVSQMCCRRLLGVGFFLVLSGSLVLGQDGGSRPIEYSEPRGFETPSATPREPKKKPGERTNIDEDLPKRFESFDFGDSLSGVASFQPPPRTQPVNRTTRAKGDKDKNDPWTEAEYLSEFDNRPEDLLLKDPNESSESEENTKEEERGRMLDSLRGEDWLVRGTMGETFWQVNGNKEKDGGSSYVPWDTMLANADSTDKIKRDELESFSPQLEGFLGQPVESISMFGYPNSGAPTFAPGYNSSSSSSGLRSWESSRTSNNKEGYRDLIGLPAQTRPDYSSTFQNFGDDGFSRRTSPAIAPAYTPPTFSSPNIVGAPSGLGNSSGSLQPVRTPDWNSLFNSSPGGAKSFNGFETPDLSVPSGPSSSPDRGWMSNPLYQPPRRQ